MYLLIIIMCIIYNVMTSILNKLEIKQTRNFQILGNELLYLVEVFYYAVHNFLIMFELY